MCVAIVCVVVGGDCEAGDAKRMANAVLPLGKGVRAAIGHVTSKGAADAFAVQGGVPSFITGFWF